MNKKVLVFIGVVLVWVGLTKPNFMGLQKKTTPVNSVVSVELKPVAEKVLDTINASTNKDSQELGLLRDLYLHISELIILDNKDMVVKTTDEIRETNSVAGRLLNISGKYPNLAKTSNDVIVAAIGNDNVPLTTDLRKKAAEGFQALSWAFDKAR